MKISMIAPPFFSLPISGYGGIERVIPGLVEGLRDRGHEVTLFAPRGTEFQGVEVISFLEPVERISGPFEHLLKSSRHSSQAHAWLWSNNVSVDVIIDHSEGGAVFGPHAVAPLVVVQHNGDNQGRHTLPYFPMVTPVAVSLSELRFMEQRGVSNATHVYYDVDVASLMRESKACIKQDYVAFIGRFHQDKRPDVAIRAAIRAGVKIKIAAPPQPANDQLGWYEAEIQPLLRHPLVDYVGLVSEAEKARFLGEAFAVLTPNTGWPEPFGLTAVETGAGGTPVITFDLGATPEIIVPVNRPPAGLVLPYHNAEDGIRQMADAIQLIASGAGPTRENCWANARRFESGMVEGYEAVCLQAIERARLR
jgi:glycosyltransferase involved in cell wall biosynthesis